MGRVGALAVALGVGAAITGFSAVATADTGTGNAAGSGGTESVRSGGSGRATDKDSAGNRRGAATAGPAATRSAAENTEDPAPVRRSGDPRSGAVARDVPARDAGIPPRVDVQVSSGAAEHASVAVDGGPPRLAVQVSVDDVSPTGSGVGGAAGIAVAPKVAATAVAEAPVLTAAQSGSLSAADTDPLTVLGGGSGNGAPIAAPLAWAVAAVSRRENVVGAAADVAPAAQAAAAAADLELCLALCTALKVAKPFIISAVALEIQKTLPAAGDAVATAIGGYAFDVINGLMLKEPNSQVAGYITGLATDAGVLELVSQTVAGLPVLAALPADVATTVGNAVGYLVQNSVGNPAVALQVVPALQAVNLPTDLANALAFIDAAKKDPAAAVLASGEGITRRELDPTQMQTAFVNFFDNAGVQSALGAAFTGTVEVLIGTASPSFAPPVNPDAVADYVGVAIATTLLGADNPNIASLGGTIGDSISGLFSSIGDDIATQAGDAFITLLQQPGVDGDLATTLVNEVVVTLGGAVPFPIHDSLLRELAPAAGVAVTDFVESLLTTPGVPAALTTFVNELLPGVLGNPGVDQLLIQTVAAEVSNLLGGGALGDAVGAQVGAAVVGLVTNPDVGGALISVVDTLLGDLLGGDGVVSSLAAAAGQLTTAELEGTLPTVLPEVVAALQANTAIQAAVGAAAGDAVTQVLGNGAVLSAVDAAISSLLTNVVGDTAVQNALAAQVSAMVSALLGSGPLGQVVGTQVGAAVVALVGNPTVSGALGNLVDTVFSDFFGAPGVVSALSGAANQLGVAAVAGTLATVLPDVAAALRANSDIESAVGTAVGAAVAQLFGDSSLWSAVDTAISSLAVELLGDTVVQQALESEVAATVSALLGGGDLGEVVGAQVGAAVVGLVTDPVVGAAVVGLVDTVFSDFFGAQGVVSALAAAADQLVLAVLGGEDPTAAVTSVLAALRANTDVEAAVGLAVGDAVAQLLGDSSLWSTVDTAISSLAAELLGDTVVQQALESEVAATVSALLGGGDLGEVVGAQVGAAVVGLVTDPVVGAAVVGLVDTVFSDFFGAQGVVSAFAAAADQFALAVVGGQDPTAAVTSVLAALRANTDVEAGVGLAVGAAVTLLLSDTAVWSEVDTAVSSLVDELLSDTVVQNALNTDIAAAVSAALGGGDLGQVVGAQIAAAVVSVVTDPLVSGAVEMLVGSAFSDFFGAPGVISAFANTADQFALAVVSGEDLTVALDDAVAALKADSGIRSALQGTIADTFALLDTAVLSNPAIQQGVGTLVTTLVVGLAESPVVQTSLAALIGPPFGDVVANLLANTAVVDQVAATLGAVFTGLLAYPGFTTALTDSLDQFTEAVLLDGAEVSAALHTALHTLFADPGYVAAINGVVTPGLNTLLASPDVRQAIAVAAQQAAVAALEQSAFHIGFLDGIAGQVVKGTVDSFLGRREATELIDSLVVNVLTGMPLSDLTQTALGEIIDKPLLQIALGMSIGAGIGSLFGDNIIGDVIGLTAGLPITLVVGIAAGIAGLIQWIVGEPKLSVDPAPAAADPYVMTGWLLVTVEPAPAQSGKSIGTLSAARMPAIAS